MLVVAELWELCKISLLAQVSCCHAAMSSQEKIAELEQQVRAAETAEDADQAAMVLK